MGSDVREGTREVHVENTHNRIYAVLPASSAHAVQGASEVRSDRVRPASGQKLKKYIQ